MFNQLEAQQNSIGLHTVSNEKLKEIYRSNDDAIQLVDNHIHRSYSYELVRPVSFRVFLPFKILFWIVRS